MSFYSKSWWYDSKTTKWQIVIGSVIIAAMQEKILIKGGGHKMACGFTIDVNNI